MRDMLSLYSGLVERCFTACSNDMTTKVLTTKESAWSVALHHPGSVADRRSINTCANKFLAFSSRVGLRFSETNAGASASPYTR